jgi:hypothetical protein
METIKAHETYWGTPQLAENDIKWPAETDEHSALIDAWKLKLNHHGLAVLPACMWCHELVDWVFDPEGAKGYHCPKCHRTWGKA